MNKKNLTLEELRKYRIVEDKQLVSKEREVHISIMADMIGKFYIDSSIKAYNEWLVNCPDFELKNYYLNQEQDAIVYLSGILPLSYLRFKKNGTSSMDYPSRVIAK